MHCLMIYAHPDTKSFTSDLRDVFLAGFAEKGHTYEKR